MNKIALISLLAISRIAYSQNNPYDVFGYESKVNYTIPKEDLFNVKNSDGTNAVKALAFDFDKKIVYLLGANHAILNTVSINDERLLRWLSVDPSANKYPGNSPYEFVKGNPINRIDPDGREDILVKQVMSSKQTSAESMWLVYPTGTFKDMSTTQLQNMTAQEVQRQFGKPEFMFKGSSLPDDPYAPGKGGTNATAEEGRFTYSKGNFKPTIKQPNGLPVLWLNQGNGNGNVSTVFENPKQGGENMANGVAAHAANETWQTQLNSGQEPTVNKGSDGCPVGGIGFGDMYKKIEKTGNFIITRDPQEVGKQQQEQQPK